MIARMAQGTSGTHPSRRVVLAGGSAALAGLLGACDVRLGSPPDSPSPTPPPPPTRDALEDVITRLRALATAADAVRSDMTGTSGAPTEASTSASGSTPGASTTAPSPTVTFAHHLGRIHRRQARRLAEAIPTTSGAPTAGGDASASSRSAPAARVSAHDLGVSERQGTTRHAVARLTKVDDQRLPTLACLAAFQAAAALRLGVEPHRSTDEAPSARVARALLTSVRPCVYALEEIAARTPSPHRDDVTASLKVMYAARSDLVTAAGDTIDPPPPAYRLPVRPDDAHARERLARTMLARVVRAAASQAPHSADDTGALRFVVRLWGESVRESWRWGGALEPFPGLGS